MNSSNKKTWYVHISNVGFKEIEGTDDIDSAYVNAMKLYGCKLEDIDAVSPNAEFAKMFDFSKDSNSNLLSIS